MTKKMGEPSEPIANDDVDEGQKDSREMPEKADRDISMEIGSQIRQDEEGSKSVDSSRDRSDHRHRKKKHRHRHRSRGSGDTVSESGVTDGGVSGGHDGDNETGGDSSGNNDNVVVSTSIRKKRSKSSSRHHRDSNRDGASGEDSGLSLGNSMNESTPTDHATHVMQEEREEANETNNKLSKDAESAETQVVPPTNSNETQNEMVTVNDRVNVNEEAIKVPLSNDIDQVETACDASTTHDDGPLPDEIIPNNRQGDETFEIKKASRMYRRLERQKTQYRLEKEMLKKRLDDTKSKFQEEITKYEQDLTEQRQQYLTQLSSLHLQEQYDSLSSRISDLAELEEELERRFKECTEQQADIEEMERYLNMRDELCRSKERDITKLDDELDAWQGELDIKKRQLEMEDTSRQRNVSTVNTSFSKPTTDEEDYILKKNLQKCQADLSRSEEENAVLHRELDATKKQLDATQLQKRNHEQKIKQLESKLVLTLSQLNNQKSNHLPHRDSLPPINGHRPSIASSGESRVEELKRQTMERRNLSLQKLNKDQLSINQEAALRRRLAGKDGGGTSSSTMNSRPSTGRLQPPDESVGTGKKPSGSAGENGIDESGLRTLASSSSAVGTENSSSPQFQKAEKSSVCLVM